MNNLVLVGFPGSGKTFLGKKLAATFRCPFIDLDAEIEKKYHYTIPQFFEKFGEFTFRKCEYITLKEILLHRQGIIATGGGTPCFKDAMKHINHHAISVYLKISEKRLIQQLHNQSQQRPLIQNLNESQLRTYVHKTLKQREPYYEKAHYILTDPQNAHTFPWDTLIKK